MPKVVCESDIKSIPRNSYTTFRQSAGGATSQFNPTSQGAPGGTFHNGIDTSVLLLVEALYINPSYQ
ncbi:hypothetical protein BASA61_004765 [Batrachochytrium salamandrivorans]|nr:hypothetical protein BASA61_004765 [Batrachochytrium salamandrivorans]